MKIKSFKSVCTMISILAILCMPIIAGAKAVPWWDEGYETRANIYEANDLGVITYNIYDEDYGPPLPAYSSLSYSDENGSYGEAYSSISASSMYAHVDAYETTPGYSMYVDAFAIFQGRYDASADYFQFSYSSNADEPLLYLNVVDESDNNTSLYDGYLSGSGVLTFPTPQWHAIYVSSWISLSSSNGSPAYDISVDYNMAVVPEPISSVLFVTGGSLLAGRRFIRMKA